MRMQNRDGTNAIKRVCRIVMTGTAITFGTDGIRGKAGQAPIDAPSLHRIGRAAAAMLAPGSEVLVGRDTRASGEELEAALAQGLAAGGAHVLLGGIVPSAAVGLAVRERGAALGIMLTASHNPARDNGVKVFGAHGDKLDRDAQQALQGHINTLPASAMAGAGEGKIEPSGVIASLYAGAIRAMAPNRPLSRLKLVVDCANGAASALAPRLLREAGADVTALHAEPDGTNINRNCGSTAPHGMQKAVAQIQADAGIAFDGDADRVVMADETGALLDGDQMLAALAQGWQDSGRLRGGAVVATQMSNLGLEHFLHGLGLTLLRTKVGDRHVAQCMKETGTNLGGEQSGHLRLPDLCPTGDGLVAALAVLKLLAASDRPASQALRPFAPVPQVLRNVPRPDGADPMAAASVVQAMAEAQGLLGAAGRLLVRPSGTEPVIRIMAESPDRALADRAIAMVAEALAGLSG